MLAYEAQSILHKLTSTQNKITTDNYDEAIVAISTAVREAITSEQEQTADNLAIVAAVFMKSAAFINDQTSIERTVSLLFVYMLHLFTQQVQVSYQAVSPHPSDCAEPSGRSGWPATMECQSVARKCFKVSQSSLKQALSWNTFNLIAKNYQEINLAKG